MSDATQDGTDGSAAEISAGATGVSAAEVARFNALASQWWDPRGPMRPLHAMNPARIGWIVDRVARRSGLAESGAAGTSTRASTVVSAGFRTRTSAGAAQRATSVASPQQAAHGVRLLDVGCGAGLASEALARKGFHVVGIDAAPDVIQAARAHGGDEGPEYRLAAAEDLLAEGRRFQVITALEVIEHVPDPAAFVRVLVRLLEPGGMLFLSTLNRTTRSLLVAKLGAEYVLRLLPVGTHDWRQFITPKELAGLLRDAGARVTDTAGLSAGPRGWSTTRDLGVNYMMAAEV